MATSRLSLQATRRAIRNFGIDKPSAVALGLWDEARNTRYEFHRHRRHQLLFPPAGLLFVETAGALFPCSAQYGLWISAGVRHATTIGPHAAVSIFFEPSRFPGFSDGPVAVLITPLLRESALRAAAQEKVPPAFADALFEVIHGEVCKNLEPVFRPSLPLAKSPQLARTVGLVFRSLASLTVSRLAAESGQSERSMRRRFVQELGMGPELFIQRARLIRAMHILAERPDCTITEIAHELGYANHSAFTTAFRRFSGSTPKEFRALLREQSGHSRSESAVRPDR